MARAALWPHMVDANQAGRFLLSHARRAIQKSVVFGLPAVKACLFFREVCSKVVPKKRIIGLKNRLRRP
jgi:hypothetical protein